MMKYTAIVTILLIISGWASDAYSRGKGEAQLIGENSSNLKVMIRTIDNGDILWVGNYKLGTKASVKLGVHNINAMCEFKYSWGTKLVPGDITINIESDAKYKITGQLSKDEKRCELSVGI